MKLLDLGLLLYIFNSDSQSFSIKDEKDEQHLFRFDKVFYEDSEQADVYEFLTCPIVRVHKQRDIDPLDLDDDIAESEEVDDQHVFEIEGLGKDSSHCKYTASSNKQDLDSEHTTPGCNR